MRGHAQREHIIYSFDALLYELFVYSYFLSPSFLRLLVRCFAQFQFTRPKDVDGARSLRFFFVGLVSINVFVLGRHFFGGETSVEGRGLLLDFVGRGLLPSRLHVILLDIIIFVLQAIALVIAYETGHHNPDLPDPLSPITTDISYPAHNEPLLRASTSTSAVEGPPESESEGYPAHLPILSLHFIQMFSLIWNSKSSTPSSSSSSLPFPNTSSSSSAVGRAGLGMGPTFRLLLQARARARESARLAAGLPPSRVPRATPRTTGRTTMTGEGRVLGSEPGTMPGAMPP